MAKDLVPDGLAAYSNWTLFRTNKSGFAYLGESLFFYMSRGNYYARNFPVDLVVGEGW